MTRNYMYDLIIIGAGPAGLSAAIEAQEQGLSYLVIEKGGIVNSIQNFPAEMSFFSTPELLEIGDLPFTSAQMRPTRAEGLEYYTRVAGYYQLRCNYFEAVTSVQKEEIGFTVITDRSEYQSQNILIATGYYDNPNYLDIPGEDLPKVSHYYDEPYPFFQQNVLVIGAKNSAAIAALELYRHGANVTLVHRGERLSEKIKYWILPDIENRIKEGSITAHFNTNVVQINDRSVLLQNSVGQFEIPNDFVFALTGYHPDYDFLASCGLELDPDTKAPKLDPTTFETNVKGIYAAGSIVAGKNNNSIFIENGRLHGKL
ncbi:MAG: YpdA family putative bacillithiol disulfide reductase, partial [Bacteroidota bacterium]